MGCVMLLTQKTGKEQMSQLLTIKNLSVTFDMEQGELPAVKDVSFSLAKHETVAIVGESGAGKSQVFHALLGLQSKNARVKGSALFMGKELINQPDEVLNCFRGKDISIIFQDPMTALNPYLKIGKQLTEVLQNHKKIPRQEAKKRVIQSLKEVMIPQPKLRFNQYPHELSGGMRQRILIAMALLCNPKLIIADEPTTALDVTVQTEIISLLRKLHDVYQSSIVLITHDIPLVAGLCDHVIIMYAGRIVEKVDVMNIHNEAKHPYTQALLKATPGDIIHQGSKSDSNKMTTIPGNPPDPNQTIQGCAFAPRCQYAKDQCKNTQPEMVKINETQTVACFQVEEEQDP